MNRSFTLSRRNLSCTVPRSRATVLSAAGLLLVGAVGGLAPSLSAQHYQQTNLVSDVPDLATFTDANLVNAWGLARSATSPWWVADNGTGVSTLYNGAGNALSLIVTVPGLPGSMEPSTPTGIVFNGSGDFQVGPSQPARFLFVTEDGTLSGWNPSANPTQAIAVVNNAGAAVYKGLAIGQINGANHLYAANFLAGTVDVFNATFQPVSLPAWAFRDPRLPDEYAPFNVQAIGDRIFVTFAKREPGEDEEIPGPGRGFVDAFSTSGELQMRLKWGFWMNAPWGVALAPAGFGKFSNMILVGQFGSGKIAAFDTKHGNFHGLLRNAHGRPIRIEGLWALGFGNDSGAGPAQTLFFTAGIDDEAHGLFGTLTPLDHCKHHGDKDDDRDDN